MHIEHIKWYARGQRKAETQEDILKMLWYSYSEHNPVKSEEITELFQTMETELKTLSRKRRNSLFRTVADLCVAHECAAFMEGVCMGIKLAMEVNGHSAEDGSGMTGLD